MSDRFENIGLLRAFAATAIVVYHVIELTGWKSFPVEGPLLTFRIGWIGVDLFFVISGFVITTSALALYRNDPRGFARRYWTRRLSRIVPLYLLTGVLWIVLFERDLFLLPMRDWAFQLATHAAFIHTFWPSTFDSIDGVNWTLGVEMQFYLCIALLVPWLLRTAGWRIWLYCILIAWAWRASMFYGFPRDNTHELFMRVIQLPGTLDEFGAGIFLAKLLHRPNPSLRAGLGWTLACAALGAGCTALYWKNWDYWHEAAMVIFWRTSLGMFLLCAVAAAIRLPSFAETWPLRPVRYLGEVSYGLYLWHLFALQLCLHLAGITPLEALGLTLCVTILLASTSWHLVERPILEFGRRASEASLPPLRSVPAKSR